MCLHMIITCYIKLGNPSTRSYRTSKQDNKSPPILFSPGGATAELRDVFSRAPERRAAAGGVAFPGRLSPGCPGRS